MNLLPKSHSEFKEKDYWNKFFQKRSQVPFEWYGEYAELCEILHKYIKPKDDIVVVGCGNSSISADMYKVGLDKIVNIDISHIVIKQMNDLYKETCPKMNFLQMDATKMSFEDDQFSVILDKGTLDALMPDENDDTIQIVDKFFDEVTRVLKTGGRYICVSLLQEHILKKLLSRFATVNFMFKIIKCHDVQETAVSLPVFIVIVTKFKELPRLILEVSLVEGVNKRLESPEDILSSINSYREACLVTNGIQNNSLDDLETIEIHLLNPSDSSVRYTVHILDQSIAKSNGKFAAFIVPQGRESEWLFSRPRGRKELLKSIPYNRVAIFSLHRGQNYGTIEDVKLEITPYIRNLAPKTANVKNPQYPILSVGNDIGTRETICKGCSSMSGDYIIEEVDVDGEIFRRLIFLKSPNLIQSEAKIKNIKQRNGKIKKVIEHGYLAFEYQILAVVGCQLALLLKKRQNTDSNILIIGLGGGSLCTFMNKSFTDATLTAVDIDPEILNIAEQHYGLICYDKMKVVINDGLKYLTEATEKGDKFEAIVFDVDSKDTSLGLSCPPKEFLEKTTLENVSECLTPEGFFILNLVCRDQELRVPIIDKLRSIFSSIASYEFEQDVNEVIFCSKAEIKWKKEVKRANECLNAVIKENSLQSGEVIDVDKFCIIK